METLQSKRKLPLIGAAEPEPAIVTGAVLATGPFVLLGDHAGKRIPAKLGDLGLSPHDLERHIALDIGVAGLGRELSQRLGAPFVSQVYSRLVVDCNRDPGSAEAIPAISDGTEVAPNRDLAPAERAERIAAIHAPYHDAIGHLLDARAAAGLRSVLVALHSFTPGDGRHGAAVGDRRAARRRSRRIRRGGARRTARRAAAVDRR